MWLDVWLCRSVADLPGSPHESQIQNRSSVADIHQQLGTFTAEKFDALIPKFELSFVILIRILSDDDEEGTAIVSGMRDI